MSEKGTYSDPRCYACRPLEPASNEIEDKRINAMLASYGITATVTEKADEIERHFPHWSEGKKAEALASVWEQVLAALKARGPNHSGRYDWVMNALADAINKRIPGPDLNTDVLRRARSE